MGQVDSRTGGGVTPLSSLDRDEVGRRIAATCPAVDIEHLFSGPGVPAAVLIGLVGYPDGPSVILTHRQPFLKHHAAEISLPGGSVEPTDEHPAAAALRETFEEVGLAADRVELLGCLGPYMTVSNFRVYPFVGWIEPPVEFKVDKREVAEVFEMPLSFVLDPANHKRESAFLRGQDHDFYVLDYPGHRVWGATAQILIDLACALTT
jgi:8-oxo-dGTP pyrophosphatase MutT (NUDIX family)